MENEGTIDETEILSEADINSQSQKAKISKLAVASVVFGMLGPLSAGALWIVSFSDFLTIGNPRIITFFSCSLAWILGLVLGVKSLEQVENSEGWLLGREYAIVGIFVSAVWMALILVGLLMPAFFSVNS